MTSCHFVNDRVNERTVVDAGDNVITDSGALTCGEENLTNKAWKGGPNGRGLVDRVHCAPSKTSGPRPRGSWGPGRQALGVLGPPGLPGSQEGPREAGLQKLDPGGPRRSRGEGLREKNPGPPEGPLKAP